MLKIASLLFTLANTAPSSSCRPYMGGVVVARSEMAGSYRWKMLALPAGLLYATSPLVVDHSRMVMSEPAPLLRRPAADRREAATARQRLCSAWRSARSGPRLPTPARSSPSSPHPSPGSSSGAATTGCCWPHSRPQCLHRARRCDAAALGRPLPGRPLRDGTVFEPAVVDEHDLPADPPAGDAPVETLSLAARRTACATARPPCAARSCRSSAAAPSPACSACRPRLAARPRLRRHPARHRRRLHHQPPPPAPPSIPSGAPPSILSGAQRSRRMSGAPRSILSGAQRSRRMSGAPPSIPSGAQRSRRMSGAQRSRRMSGALPSIPSGAQRSRRMKRAPRSIPSGAPPSIPSGAQRSPGDGAGAPRRAERSPAVILSGCSVRRTMQFPPLS